VKSIKEQCEASETEISVRNLSGLRSCVLLTGLLKSVFLVGGFAASDWLYQNLKSEFASQGLDVSRPDSHVCVFSLEIPRSGTNDSLASATKPSLTALYPSTLIILCLPESRSLLTG
jgi:hypothetical protein